MSSKKKKNAREKQTNKKIEQKSTREPQSDKRRRRSVWTTVLVPFGLLLFVFGGTDALLLRDLRGFATALFFIAALNWGVFFSLKNRWLEWGISAALILGWFGVTFFVLPPVRCSRETTYITEPKKSDGREVDYFPAIAERIHPPQTWNEPEKNGFRDLVSALGPAMLDSFKWESPTDQAEYWEKLCEKLEMDAKTMRDSPPMKFQAAESFFAQHLPAREPTIKEVENLDTLTDSQADKIKEVDINEQKIIELDAGKLRIIEQPLTPFQWVERLSNDPWTAQQFPKAKQWLEQNESVLDLFAQSVRKEKFACPLLRFDENQPVNSIVKWGRYFTFFNRSFPIRVQYELGCDKPEKAWDDVLTQFLSAQRFFEQICSVEDYFYADSLWNDAARSATAVVRHVAQNDTDKEKTLKFLEQKLADTERFFEPFSKDVEANLLFGERLSVLDLFQAAAFGRQPREEMLRQSAEYKTENGIQVENLTPEEIEKIRKERQKENSRTETFFSSLSKRGLCIFSWNESLKKINRYFDEVELLQSNEAAFAKTLFLQSNNQAWESAIRIGFLKALPDKIAHLEVMIWIDNSRSLERQVMISRAKSALLRCAFYLEMYKIEHESYPKSLAQLEEKYGDKIPHDPCSSTKSSLKYSLREDGSYLLYSIGPNKTDDAGASRKEKKDADDITL